MVPLSVFEDEPSVILEVFVLEEFFDLKRLGFDLLEVVEDEPELDLVQRLHFFKLGVVVVLQFHEFQDDVAAFEFILVLF